MNIQNVLRELPEDAQERKGHPITTGVLDYFPLALAEVAGLSKKANDQHNPGQPMHWARHKSGDHADCLVRHLIQRGLVDTDGQRHTAKVAWRALALLQEEIEADYGFVPAEATAAQETPAQAIVDTCDFPVEVGPLPVTSDINALFVESIPEEQRPGAFQFLVGKFFGQTK